MEPVAADTRLIQAQRRQVVLEHQLGETAAVKTECRHSRKAEDVAVLFHSLILQQLIAKAAEIEPAGHQLVAALENAAGELQMQHIVRRQPGAEMTRFGMNAGGKLRRLRVAAQGIERHRPGLAKLAVDTADGAAQVAGVDDGFEGCKIGLRQGHGVVVNRFHAAVERQAGGLGDLVRFVELPIAGMAQREQLTFETGLALIEQIVKACSVVREFDAIFSSEFVAALEVILSAGSELTETG